MGTWDGLQGCLAPSREGLGELALHCYFWEPGVISKVGETRAEDWKGQAWNARGRSDERCGLRQGLNWIQMLGSEATG